MLVVAAAAATVDRALRHHAIRRRFDDFLKVRLDIARVFPADARPDFLAGNDARNETNLSIRQPTNSCSAKSQTFNSQGNFQGAIVGHHPLFLK